MTTGPFHQHGAFGTNGDRLLPWRCRRLSSFCARVGRLAFHLCVQRTGEHTCQAGIGKKYQADSMSHHIHHMQLLCKRWPSRGSCPSPTDSIAGRHGRVQLLLMTPPLHSHFQENSCSPGSAYCCQPVRYCPCPSGLHPHLVIWSNVWRQASTCARSVAKAREPVICPRAIVTTGTPLAA